MSDRVPEQRLPVKIQMRATLAKWPYHCGLPAPMMQPIDRSRAPRFECDVCGIRVIPEWKCEPYTIIEAKEETDV